MEAEEKLEAKPKKRTRARWLLTETANPTVFSYACDANGDGVIDMEDYAVLSNNWLTGL